MTVSSTDTAEVPRVSELVVPRLVLAPAPTTAVSAPERFESEIVPSVASVAVAPGRVALQVERRLARRQRLLWSLLGLSIMVVTLAVTVVVLNMAR
jgi:hypothetical protein